jgi:hypothetical protein
MRAALAAACALITVGATACNFQNQTTTPTPSPASPTVSENWSGTLVVGGAKFYSFTVSQYGTVNITLASFPAAVPVGLSIGEPQKTTCSGTSNATTVQPGATAPQLTGAFVPGVHCLLIYDVGSLTDSSPFAVTIDHP